MAADDPTRTVVVAGALQDVAVAMGRPVLARALTALDRGCRLLGVPIYRVEVRDARLVRGAPVVVRRHVAATRLGHRRARQLRDELLDPPDAAA